MVRRQTLDHFDFYNSTATFQQRYLVNDTWYLPGGPVYFYTGTCGRALAAIAATRDAIATEL